MPNLLDPQEAELQNMRVEIVAFLRESELISEESKANFMIMVPYLPMNQLKPIFETLKKEMDIKKERTRVRFENAKGKIKAIRQEMWQTAEKNTTPPLDKLDQAFDSALSQL